MAKPHLASKPPRDDQSRRDHQRAVKQSLIELPAFGLTLLAASVKRGADAGYENYELPNDGDALAFTLKGAIRLEMMNSGNALWMKYRRLFGANTKAGDLSAWRSRVYIEAFESGRAAAQAALALRIPGRGWGMDELIAALQPATATTVLLQVNDVFIDEARAYLFSDVLRSFIERDSRLLEFIGFARVLSSWNELEGGPQG